MDTSTLGVWSGKIVVVDPFAPPEPWWEEPAEVVEAWDAMERYYEDHLEALEAQRLQAAQDAAA